MKQEFGRRKIIEVGCSEKSRDRFCRTDVSNWNDVSVFTIGNDWQGRDIHEKNIINIIETHTHTIFCLFC